MLGTSFHFWEYNPKKNQNQVLVVAKLHMAVYMPVDKRLND